MSDRVYFVTRVGGLVGDREPQGWSTSAFLEGYSLECVAADPKVPDRAFVGTFENGLHRTVDGGGSFDRIGEGTIAHDAVTSVTVSPHDPDEVWAGTEPSTVYRSVDGGDTWEERPGLDDLPSADEWFFPPRPHTHHVRWIEIDPHDPAVIYIGIEAGAFVRSTDGGRSWEERPPGSRRDNHTLATHANAEGRVLAAAGDGFALSDDSGRTWTHPQDGLEHRYVWGLGVDPGDPDTVIVSAAHGAGYAHRSDGTAYLYRTTDLRRWERLDDRGIPTGPGTSRAIIDGGTRPGSFFAATESGLYLTDDAGDAWERLPIERPDSFEGELARGLAGV